MFSQIFVIEGEIACKSPVPEEASLMKEVGIKPDFRSPKEFRTELGQELLSVQENARTPEELIYADANTGVGL